MAAIIVARCGLVCSECGAFKKKKCDGCDGPRVMFKNCPVKQCATERRYDTCASCAEYSELKKCKKLNNVIARIIGFLFRSDRIGNLAAIRKTGMDAFKSRHTPDVHNQE